MVWAGRLVHQLYKKLQLRFSTISEHESSISKSAAFEDALSNHSLESFNKSNTATSPDEYIYLCTQCRLIDFNEILDHMARLGQAEAGDIVVQNRRGLSAECKLCWLFLRFVLPGTYSYPPEPDSDTPWQLRAFSIRCMLVDSRTQNLFRPAPITLLHAGDGQRDYIKNNDSERVEKVGYLAFGRTAELFNASSSNEVGGGLWSQTAFMTEHYSPSLITHWLQYAKSGLSRHDDSEYSSDEACDKDDGNEPMTARDARSDKSVAPESIDDPADESSGFNSSNATEDGSEPVDIKGMMVIDCYTSEILSWSPDMPYIALSYVWKLAHDDMVSLDLCLQTSLKPGANKLLPSLVPRVVHNAIQVTRDLDYRYLWVDQFCIDQSAPAEQIAEQISKMDLIYSSAQMTIIAVGSRGALPGVGSTPRNKTVNWKITLPDEALTESHQEITIFNTPPPLHFEITRQVWFSRGWCFQESLLSPQKLYFTDNQMFFEAEGVHCCDTYPVPGRGVDLMLDSDFEENPSLVWFASWRRKLVDASLDCEHDLSDPRGQFWTEINILFKLLEVYTAKDLTADTDSINGFAGALKIFAKNDAHFRTLGGIPILDISRLVASDSIDSQYAYSKFQWKCFTFALEWKHEETSRRRKEFPTWSWAGWKGKACWNSMVSTSSDLVPRLRIMAVEDDKGRIFEFIDVPRIIGRPRFLIGEGVLIPPSIFLFSHIWQNFTKEESASSVIKWRASSLRSSRHESRAIEEQMCRRFDKGIWACLLLNEKCGSTPHHKARATLLVVEWEPQDGSYHQVHRKCTRIGVLDIFCLDVMEQTKNPFAEFPKSDFHLG